MSARFRTTSWPTRLQRHQARVRVQDRPAYHAQVHRQQRGDRRNPRAVAGEAGAPAGGDQQAGRGEVGGVGSATAGRRRGTGPRPTERLKQWWASVVSVRPRLTPPSPAVRYRVLYDQPLEGQQAHPCDRPLHLGKPVTHRVLATDEALPASEQRARRRRPRPVRDDDPGEPQDRRRAEHGEERAPEVRLPRPLRQPLYPRQCDYTESDGTTRTVGVCIGPEHGTVGPQLVKEAAKEAVQGVGFDTLIVCGFAFDPHVTWRRPATPSWSSCPRA